MPACKNTKYTGRRVLLEYHISCGDTVPASNDWTRMGSMRSKEMNLEWDTTDGTTDDSVGNLRDNLATFLSMSISGDGVLREPGAGMTGLTELTKHFANPLATGGQPYVWMRMTYPDLTFTAFMLLSTFSRGAPHDDVATYSIEASATSGETGLIIEDTPPVDSSDVTSVTVTPETAALAVGGTEQLTALVAPATAYQVVDFTSSNLAVATVNPQGLITAVGTGTATITARAASDSTKWDTCVVTVS